MTKTKKNDPGTLADRMRGRLEQLSMGYADLAGPLGVTRQTVGQWCQGATAPSSASIVKAADVLRVNAAWLADGTGPKGLPGALTPVERRMASLRAELRQTEARAKSLRASLRALARERDEAEDRAAARRGPA